MKFEMYADVQFSRYINKETDYISPGAFEIESNGRRYSFDFEDYDGTIDKEDPSVLHIHLEYPDEECFKDLADITENTLRGITKFTEFFIYIGEEFDTGVRPEKLLGCYFEIYRGFGEENEIITLSEQACNSSELRY